MSQATKPQQKPCPDHTTPVRHTWDTSYVAPNDRFSYFREGVCQAFLALSPEKPDGREIQARVETVDLQRGMISKIEVTPHRVFRTKTDVAGIPGEFVSLDLQLAGGLQGSVNGKPYAQKAGDVTVLDINKLEYFDINKDQMYSTTVLIFDKSILSDYARFENFTSIRQPSLSAVSGCLQLLNGRYRAGSHAELTSLFDASISLLVADLIKDDAYLEERCDTELSTRAGIIQAIKDYVGHNIRNADLSTNGVAHHFGISTRYVQKLFANDGATFKCYMTNLRLDQIRLDLLNPSLAHVSSGDIAFGWGFRDMTTFHRNFKHRFGDTPGQIRTLGRACSRFIARAPA